VAPTSVDATVVVGQKPGVKVEEEKLTSLPGTFSVAPFSVNIYSFALK